MSFLDPVSDWYSASVPVISYVIYYTIGPRYNGTRLHMTYGNTRIVVLIGIMVSRMAYNLFAEYDCFQQHTTILTLRWEMVSNIRIWILWPLWYKWSEIFRFNAIFLSLTQLLWHLIILLSNFMAYCLKHDKWYNENQFWTHTMYFISHSDEGGPHSTIVEF